MPPSRNPWTGCTPIVVWNDVSSRAQLLRPDLAEFGPGP